MITAAIGEFESADFLLKVAARLQHGCICLCEVVFASQRLHMSPQDTVTYQCGLTMGMRERITGRNGVLGWSWLNETTAACSI